MHLYLSLPLFEEVAREVLGKAGGNVTLRDVSGGRDATLSHILSLLHQELLVESEGSQLFVEGLAQSLAVHLVRRYSESGPDTPKQNALPGSKLRRAIAFMREHLDEPFDLARLARSVGMSKFHFSRLFKKSIGVSPSRLEPHIPVFDKSARTNGTFAREDFAYDQQSDVYICPAGKVLTGNLDCSSV